jgi:Tol biopolymer transport system component
MQLIARLLILFGFLLTLTTTTMLSARQGEAQTEWIAYLSNTNGTTDLYVMAPDGRDKRQLTDNMGLIGQPVWSPTSAWMTVSALSGPVRLLYKVHVTGHGTHAIADQSGTSGYTSSLAVSPDGKHLAYIGIDHGVYGIYVVKSSGGGTRTRIASFRRSITVPSGLTWSPDGEWITYNTANIIMRVRPDGRDNTQLTSSSDYLRDVLPSWSPDGQFLLYHSMLGNTPVIYRIRNERPILNQVTDASIAFELPNWSPKGNLIAAVGTESFGNSADPMIRTGQSGRDLYVMSPDGDNLTQLTEGFWLSEMPQWSPDGEWLVFTTTHVGLSTIFRIRPDGSDLQQLTDHLASYRSPSWSRQINMSISGNLLIGIGLVLIAGAFGFGRFSQALTKRLDERVIMKTRLIH